MPGIDGSLGAKGATGEPGNNGFAGRPGDRGGYATPGRYTVKHLETVPEGINHEAII